ncbi:MAG TPA: DUF5684 domain-containing protein [Candidatus Udaeobacter sp.]|nr:DUF5684 domain-containing protein [Candidatus Udaeobacter sp.]
MNLSMKLHSAARWAAVPAITLLSASAAFAQENRPHASPALSGAILICALLIGLAVYVYVALAVQTIAEKTNTDNSWLAWIPIANFVLLLNIAGKPIWWIVLCLIPLVNIIIIIMIWMAVAEARRKPSWWGVLMVVPVVSIIVPGYLAWSD